MSGVISLDDISSNDGSSTESNNNDSDSGSDFAALESACNAIGADFEAAKEAVKHRSGIEDEDNLIELAEALESDDELWNLMEEYRTMTDKRRILENHLYNSDKEFTGFAGLFWGDSDNPDDGTYNDVQQRSRDTEYGNLYFYKALFPEPDMEHFPSDNAVLWQERPDDDAHIYVTEEYVAEYDGFTLDIDGKARPVPPWDGADTDGSSGSGGALDPREHTISELENQLDNLDVDELEQLLEVEKKTKCRKGAKNAIRDEIDARENDDSDSGSDSDEKMTVTINGNEVTGTPEEVNKLMEMQD